MDERPPDPHDPPLPGDAQPPPTPSEPQDSGPPPVAPPIEPPPPISSGPPADSPGAGPPPADSWGLDPIPWEQPGLGFFAGFYETLRVLVVSPRQAYRRVGTTRAFARPIGFALLVGWPGILAATLWDVALRRQMESWMPWTDNPNLEGDPMLSIVFALAAPLWIPIFLLCAAALQHLFLWMVGGAKRGYVDTFRVLCYAQVASLAGVVPLFGTLAAALWHVVLQVIGLSAVHRIGTARAVFAILLPGLLCCACLAILFSIFGAAWMAGMKGGH